MALPNRDPIARSRPARRRGRTVLIAAAGLLALPMTALAGTVTVSGTTVSFAAGVAESNDLIVTFNAGTNTYTFNEATLPITPGAGCVAGGNATIATCVLAGATALTVDLGDEIDDYSSTGVATPTTVNGGPGGDEVDTGAGVDTINGGDGDDDLDGNGGNDTVSGGAGQDRILGGIDNDTMNGDTGNDTFVDETGGDVIAGGTGRDEMTYAGRAVNVTVTLDDVANDGSAAELDNVRSDVEDVTGGAGNDSITGSNRPNELLGGDGNDTLIGLGGTDDLDGGSGFDTLDGGADDDDMDGGLDGDVINGGADNDTVTYASRIDAVIVSLNGTGGDGEAGENDNVGTSVENVTGGRGADRLLGNRFPNRLLGGPGNDILSGGDAGDDLEGQGGADRLNGGLGRDSMNGGNDADFLFARDLTADDVFCGAGSDFVVTADRTGPTSRRDRISPACERGGPS